MFQIVDVRVVDTLPAVLDDVERKGVGFVESMLQINEQHRSRPRSSTCTVMVFGCTAGGASCLVRVTDFRPVLYFDTGGSQSDAALIAQIAHAVDVPSYRLQTQRVLRKNMYGWVPNSMDHPTDRKQHVYLEVHFPTVASMRLAADEFRRHEKFRCHEDSIPVETQFFDRTNLVPSGWVSVPESASVCAAPISHCRVEVECRLCDLTPDDRPDIAPLMVAFVDIECFSATGGFPDADIRADEIVQVGVNYWRVGSPKEDVVKVLYVASDHCGPVGGAHVVRCPDESSMLREFRSSCMLDVDPDILATFNGFGFDLEYLYKRAKLHFLDDFEYLDRAITHRCWAKKKELSSGALGQNELFVIDMYGRCNLDLYHWVKAREKLPSYKLDAVAEHFLGERKLEMDYKELFRMSRGTPAEIARVGQYCLQDCYLLVLLCIRLQVFAANVEMSRVTHTSMEMLVTRGQQVKVMNQAVWYSHRMSQYSGVDGAYIMNTPAEFSGSASDKYEGATVLSPIKGFHREHPIAVLDFMALYPSIICANNFCYSCLVQDAQYDSVPGVEYVTIQGDSKTYRWAKNMPGVIPVMMRALLSARKDAKKLMAAAAQRREEATEALAEAEAAGDSAASSVARERLAKAQVERAVYDARQLALKVSANSIYGFTGAVNTGKYPCLAIAECVTYRAREYLTRTVRLVEEYTNNQCRIVYGDTDSVMVEFRGLTDVEQVGRRAQDAATWISSKFPDDVVLEFEKVYFPWLLMGKKRYAGVMWVLNREGCMVQDKLDAKGIEVVRRDSAPVARNMQAAVLDALMYKRDVALACRAIESGMRDIVSNTVPLCEYKMSKGRRKNYVTEQLPHVNVCKKMAARRPGSEPQVGDRVPYVLLYLKNHKTAKCWEKAEDIGYVEQHPETCHIDRLHYVTHQIEKPVGALMQFSVSDVSVLFDPFKVQLQLERQNQQTLAACDGVTVVAKTPRASCVPQSVHAAGQGVATERCTTQTLLQPTAHGRSTTSLQDSMFAVAAASGTPRTKSTKRGRWK